VLLLLKVKLQPGSLGEINTPWHERVGGSFGVCHVYLWLKCPWAGWSFEAARTFRSIAEAPGPVAAPVPVVTCG